ncbi:MAG: hypothetical protein U0T11_05315 [Chitinophagaceae bacterium]
MTTTIIITICSLLLLAYAFDLSASKTKIPSVILLLVLGYVCKQLTDLFQISIPDLAPTLPLLGTIGLILIVLEGSLELEFNASKLKVIGKAAVIALIPMLILAFGMAYILQQYEGVPLKNGLANAIPLAIISSAIAIPSAAHLLASNKEFITYESSLSDILGVILFNFITLNDNIGSESVGSFSLQLLLMLAITFVVTIGLAFLLSRIRHHIKYSPIIIMVILIYALSKYYHLPALIFILLFGLFLGNLDELKNNRFIQKLKPEILNDEVHKFKELTTEIAFLVRALFFLLFGFLINSNELFNHETILWAIGICVSVLFLRFLFLKAFKMEMLPVLFIAPRGLITILLFLNIPSSQAVSLVNKSLIIQVIILGALIMMIGLMINKPVRANVKQSNQDTSEEEE